MIEKDFADMQDSFEKNIQQKINQNFNEPNNVNNVSVSQASEIYQSDNKQ